MIGIGPSRRGNSSQQIVGALSVYTPINNIVVTFQQNGLTFGNTTDNPAAVFQGTGPVSIGGTLFANNRALITAPGGGELISLTGGAAGAANVSYISFRDSNGNRTGYVGDAFAGDAALVLSSDNGPVRLIPNGGTGVGLIVTSNAFTFGDTVNNPSFTFAGTGAGAINGNWVFTAPAGAGAIEVIGAANVFAQTIFGSGNTSQSFGIQVAAGTNNTDFCAYFENRAANQVFLFIRGDGQIGMGPNQNLAINSAGTVVMGNSSTSQLVVNGAFGTTPLVVNSSSSNSSAAADFSILRTASTGNALALGANIELQDGGAGTASLLQHSGGQTEMWQFNSGAWVQVSRFFSPRIFQILDDGGVMQTVGWRGMPVNTVSGNYTAQLSDRGKIINMTTNATITIPSNVFQIDDTFSVRCPSPNSITVASGSGLTLNWVGNGSATGNRTLTGEGICTVVFFSSAVASITGGGLS